jgi:hypothetical protein
VTDLQPVPRMCNAHVAPAQRLDREDTCLRDRVPGQAVITALLHEQRSVPPRSRIARLLGVSPLSPDAWPWYRGALGEIAVGRTLTTAARDRWYVLHAVPVGSRGADIDHLIVGPGGIFTVNTKHHQDQDVWVAGRTFMVAGQKQGHIPKAEHEADRAARLLSRESRYAVSVKPLIVVVNARRLTVRENPTSAIVLASEQLLPWLRCQDVVLSHEEVLRVVAVAQRPATWGNAAVVGPSPDVVQASFAALQREIASANRIRIAWALGLSVSAVGAISASLARLLLA